VKPNRQFRTILSPYGDKEYIDLVIRLFEFQEHVRNKYGMTLTPRIIDTFLLNY
jgi:hypothetical protein